MPDATLLLGTADRGPGASDHEPGRDLRPSANDEQPSDAGTPGAGGQDPCVTCSASGETRDSAPFGDHGQGGCRPDDQVHGVSRRGPGANDQEPQMSHGSARARPCALSVPLPAGRGEQEEAPVPLLPPPAKTTDARAASAPPPRRPARWAAALTRTASAPPQVLGAWCHGGSASVTSGHVASSDEGATGHSQVDGQEAVPTGGTANNAAASSDEGASRVAGVGMWGQAHVFASGGSGAGQDLREDTPDRRNGAEGERRGAEEEAHAVLDQGAPVCLCVCV